MSRSGVVPLGLSLLAGLSSLRSVRAYAFGIGSSSRRYHLIKMDTFKVSIFIKYCPAWTRTKTTRTRILRPTNQTTGQIYNNFYLERICPVLISIQLFRKISAGKLLYFLFRKILPSTCFHNFFPEKQVQGKSILSFHPENLYLEKICPVLVSINFLFRKIKYREAL